MFLRLTNNTIRKLHIISLVVIFSCITACASDRMITIDSQPQGAEVIADGKGIGKTPLKISPDDVFPPRWIGGSYMVKGNLEMKMPDCEPVSMKVNDTVLSKNIDQALKCTQQKPSPPARDTPTPTSVDGGAVAVEQRLEQLQQLRSKGLISEQEYQAQRQRILNEL